METEKLSAESNLLLDEEGMDVTFIVEGERVKANRKILASRCEYFRTLLFGDSVESTQKEIPLDVKAEPFKYIRRYLYTREIQLSNLTVEKLVDVLHLAHKYDIGELATGMITKETIHWILNTAVLYDMKELLAGCLKFADRNVPDMVRHVVFTSLSDAAVKELLKRDTFAAAEIDIFHAVKAWCDKRPTRENADIMGLVRWSLMSSDDLSSVVQSSGVVSPDLINQKRSGRLPIRSISYTINVAESYIDLGRRHNINFIQWSEDFCIQSVEVSAQPRRWKRLSFSESQGKDMPFGWKYRKFSNTNPRYIRLYNDAGELFVPEFSESSFAVMYRSDI